MRKYLICSIFLLIIVVLQLNGDGPPMDKDGNIIRSEFVRLELNDAQLKQVNTMRVFELTEAQNKKLAEKKIAKLKIMEVITQHYDDCTCGMGTYGIWNKPKSVDVPFWGGVKKKEPEVEKKPEVKSESVGYGEIPEIPDNIKDYIVQMSENVITLNTDGKMFVKDKQVLIAYIEKNMLKMEQDGKSISIKWPPFFDDKIKKKAMETDALIRKIGAKHKVMVYPEIKEN